jgi:hypothetical protein
MDLENAALDIISLPNQAMEWDKQKREPEEQKHLG